MTKITVSRISGESFDLVSGKALPKAVVLTNGSAEIPIYVTDEIAMAVLELSRGNGQAVEAPLEEPKKRPKKAAKKEPVDELEAYRDEATGVPSL